MHKSIFEPHTIREDCADVLTVERCLIGRSGVCFGRKGPIKGSYHAAYRELKSELTRATIRHSLRYGISPFPHGGGSIVFHNPWSGGYYHWLIEAVPRLLRLRNDWGRRRMIIPRNIPNKWFNSWLESISGGNFVYLDRGALFARRVVMAENPKSMMHFSRPDIQDLRTYFHNLLNVADEKERRKIYISRRLATHRRISNEPSLLAALEVSGFQAVCSEELSFPEQVKIFSGADVVVSVHGAGLSNSVFMKPGSSIIEIAQNPSVNLTYGTRRKTHLLNPCFRALADCCDLRHRLVLGEFNRDTTSNAVIDRYGTLHGDIQVDIGCVMGAVSEVMTDND